MAQLNLPLAQPNFRQIELELSSATLFRSLELSRGNEGALSRLAELVFEKEFGEGEILIQEGELQLAVLIFVEGRVAGTKGSSTPFENAAKVAVFDKNSSFGASSLLDAVAATMTLTAETYGRTYVLDQMAFSEFGKEFPEVALQIQGTIARDLMDQIKKAQVALRLLHLTLSNLSA